MTKGDRKVVPIRKMLNLQGRRQMAWRLRHDFNWTLERIGSRLGMCDSAIGAMLRREAEIRSRSATWFLPTLSRRRQKLRAFSLSNVFNA